MSEQIHVNGRGVDAFPSFFCIAAITRAMNELGIDVPSSNPMEVTLTVNGVEVPFVATINDIWERTNHHIDERVKEEAVRLVTEAGLEQVADALRDVEDRVRTALDLALSGRQS